MFFFVSTLKQNSKLHVPYSKIRGKDYCEENQIKYLHTTHQYKMCIDSFHNMPMKRGFNVMLSLYKDRKKSPGRYFGAVDF